MCKPNEAPEREQEQETPDVVPGWTPPMTPDPGPREPSRRELPGPAWPGRTPTPLEPAYAT